MGIFEAAADADWRIRHLRASGDKEPFPAVDGVSEEYLHCELRRCRDAETDHDVLADPELMGRLAAYQQTVGARIAQLVAERTRTSRGTVTVDDQREQLLRFGLLSEDVK